MWTTEVRPRSPGADGLILRHDGVAHVVVLVGGGRSRRFGTDEFERLERLVGRVVAGRGWRRKPYA